jgi:hypothetical protein
MSGARRAQQGVERRLNGVAQVDRDVAVEYFPQDFGVGDLYVAPLRNAFARRKTVSSISAVSFPVFVF